MKGFKTIATSYSGTQAGLIIATLEACKIDVLTRNYHPSITLSNYTHAIGGIDICVPQADAQAARDILLDSHPLETAPLKPWVVPVLIFAFLLAGVPPPGSGVILGRNAIERVLG